MINLSNIILDVVNNLFSNLFSSIDLNLDAVLDYLVFLSPDIIFGEKFVLFFDPSTITGIISVAKGLAYAVCLYYCITLILSYFTFSQIQQPIAFVFKLFFALVAITYSKEICNFLVLLNHLLCLFIRTIGENILEIPISFSAFLDVISKHQSTLPFNLFSINGLLSGFVSISFIFITLSYTLRFIMIKVFILIFPFAVLTLVIPNFSWFFKSWFKTFLSLLLLQIFIALILTVSLSLNFNNFPIPSFLALGCIYALLKANSLLRDFMGGLSTDFNMNLSNIQSLFKN